MKLVLVRHGETPWNHAGRFQGQSNIGLSPRGLEQARAVANVLKRIEPHALYSSPLPRTMQMAQVIATALSLPIVPIEDLKELDLGELEGITGDRMQANYPEIYHGWGMDPSRIVMPGGESLHQLQERAWRGVQQIELNHPKGVAVAVSHNFAIVTVVCRLLEIPLSRFHHLRLDLGSVTTIESSDQRWRLASFNERYHLCSSHIQES